MSDLSYVFMSANTLVSLNENSENVNISEVIVKNSSTNNQIMLKINDANVTINASSNISITSNLTITGNTFVLGASNNSANGFSMLPNGILMQWGTVSSSRTAGDVTFTIPFPTSLLSFTSTARTTNSAFNYTYTPVLIASNTTTANVRTSNTSAVNVTWIAIGI